MMQMIRKAILTILSRMFCKCAKDQSRGLTCACGNRYDGLRVKKSKEKRAEENRKECGTFWPQPRPMGWRSPRRPDMTEATRARKKIVRRAPTSELVRPRKKFLSDRRRDGQPQEKNSEWSGERERKGQHSHSPAVSRENPVNSCQFQSRRVRNNRQAERPAISPSAD